jgi:spermidine synthase
MNDIALAAIRPALVTEPMNAHVGLVYQYTRLIERRHSALQTIEVLDTPAFGRVLRLDGVTMTSEHDEFFYHENLVHVPGVAHSEMRDVAIIGGGDGGALREVLRHACVERAALVEIDPAVVEVASRHLPQVHRGAFRDHRVTLHFADGRAWLERRDDRFDLLILDLTDPVGPAHSLHTAEFYRLCRERLHPGGIVGLHVQSPVTRPRAFARIVHTLRSVFTHVRPYLVFVPTYGTWFAMATASMDVDPLAETAEALTRRLEERKLTDLRYYNAATHFAGFALPNFVRDLLRSPAPVATDAGPRLDEDPEFASTFARSSPSGPYAIESAVTCPAES